MNIVNTLKKEELFSSGEKNIASYITNHLHDIPNMSIQQLASLTYSSNPTILRVCRKCGAKGFKDFKIQLTKEIEHLEFDINHVDVNIPFHYSETCKGIAKQIGELYHESISRTYAKLTSDILIKASRILEKSNSIYLFGYGDSNIHALNLKNKLIKINKNAIIAMEQQQQIFHAYNMNKQDCAIFITYRGTKKFLPIIKYVSQKQVPIICITANVDSTIAKYSNVVIEIAKNEDEKTKIASFSSQIEIEYICNILYACLFEKDYEKNYKYKNIDTEFLYDSNLI